VETKLCALSESGLIHCRWHVEGAVSIRMYVLGRQFREEVVSEFGWKE
jgi:hypothetical protein